MSKVKNPLSDTQKEDLGRWSKLCATKGLLKPYQRRYLYFGYQYEGLYADIIPKLSAAIEDLKPLLNKAF